jgi:hypothetical protein
MDNGDQSLIRKRVVLSMKAKLASVTTGIKMSFSFNYRTVTSLPYSRAGTSMRHGYRLCDVKVTVFGLSRQGGGVWRALGGATLAGLQMNKSS